MLRFRSVTLLGFALLTALSGSSAESADWPQWRGPNRDGLSKESGLLESWPEDGPKVLWQIDKVGEAFSSVSVANGKVYTLGNVDGEGRIICIDEKTGDVLWSVRSPAEKREYTHRRGNGARGTPTVDGDRVYAEGGGGDVTCLNAETGDVIWSLHLVDDLGGRVPGWGYSESPLVDGNRLIITPGGNDGAVAAVNKLTGDVIWRSTDVTDRAHYCSAIVAEIAGVKQIIQFTQRRLVGLDAETGKLLWDYSNSANGTANVSSPIAKDNLVFSSSAYGTGGGVVEVTKTGGDFEAEEVWFEKSMQSHHGGVILIGDHLYGFGSRSLMCMDLESGEIVWQDRSVGKGSVVYADGHLYCLAERNKVGLVEAQPDEYVEKGRFDIPRSDYNSWAHPVVANGRLYIRDQDSLTCYQVATGVSSE